MCSTLPGLQGHQPVVSKSVDNTIVHTYQAIRGREAAMAKGTRHSAVDKQHSARRQWAAKVRAPASGDGHGWGETCGVG